MTGPAPLDGAREALERAELVRSKGRSTPDTCPNCPPEAHVCHHEDEMRAWGDLPDVTYTNEQAADRALAALSSAGYQVVKVEEQASERGFEQPGGRVAIPWGSVVDVTHATHERQVWRGPWVPVSGEEQPHG